MENVVDLFSKSRRQGFAPNAQGAKAPANVTSEEVTTQNTDFAAIAERNAAIQAKLKKEREQANKNVLKSYRIK